MCRVIVSGQTGDILDPILHNQCSMGMKSPFKQWSLFLGTAQFSDGVDAEKVGRVGSDPVEVPNLVCQAFYEKNKAHYPEIQSAGLLEKVQIHAWSHADAWAIHKMLSYIRNIVPKYERRARFHVDLKAW